MSNMIIDGHVFLVGARPNMVLDNPNIANYYADHDVAIRGETVKITNQNQLFVQIWCSSSDSLDWQSFGIKIENESEKIRDFPEWVPAESLSGLREGDAFEIEYRGRKFRLTCEQMAHKYSMYGPFQRALKRIIGSYCE